MLVMVGFLFAGGERASAAAIDTQETTSIGRAKSFDYFTDNNKNGVDDRLEEKKSEPEKERRNDSGSSFIKRLLNSTDKSRARYSNENTSRKKSSQSDSKKSVEQEKSSNRSERHSTEKKDSGGKSYRTK